MRGKLLLVLGGLFAIGAALGLATVRAQETEEAQEAPVVAVGGSGYLGVYLEEVDGDALDRLGLREERGALIGEVVEDSPAADAGLRENDVIVGYNGEAVQSIAGLSRLVRETPAGRTVTLDVVRDGQTRQIQVELGERPGVVWVGPDTEGDFRINVAPHYEGDAPYVFAVGGRGRLGVQLQSLTEQLGDYFGVGDGDGALVTSVREDSPAAAAGLRAGDVITRVGDTDVEDPGDVARAVGGADAGSLSITVIRDGSSRTLTAELPERHGNTWEWESEAGAYSFVIPDIGIPEIVIPEISTPSVVIPEIRIPSFEIEGGGEPWLVIPEVVIPEFDIPEFSIPEIRVPETDVPGRTITILGPVQIV